MQFLAPLPISPQTTFISLPRPSCGNPSSSPLPQRSQLVKSYHPLFMPSHSVVQHRPGPCLHLWSLLPPAAPQTGGDVSRPCQVILHRSARQDAVSAPPSSIRYGRGGAARGGIHGAAEPSCGAARGARAGSGGRADGAGARLR